MTAIAPRYAPRYQRSTALTPDQYAHRLQVAQNRRYAVRIASFLTACVLGSLAWLGIVQALLWLAAAATGRL